MTDRRGFLFGAASCTTLGALSGCRSVAGVSRQIDPDLAVLISDCHVNGVLPGHMAAETEKTLAQILRLNPLPAKVIHFGDISASHGQIEDYRLSQRLFQPLADAGIELAWMMGNHDHRAPFAEVYPDWAASSLVAGRIVHLVALPSVDLVLLDSLGKEEPWGAPVDGEITGGQLEWLAAFAAKTRRPYFVCAHHDGRQMKAFAQAAMGHSPLMCGYLHGHRHSWMTDALHNWKNGGRLVRSVGLPSGGAWGDIGFATLRDAGTSVTLTLHERDSWFPKPTDGGRRTPVSERLVRENDGARVTIDLPNRAG